MIIGNRDFDLKNECYIMGILNVTPDSFSDGGKWNSVDAALKHTEKMISDGCDILDIGGESTRPGHVQISDEEEIERVAPVIEAVKNNFDVPVSLDTYKSRVAAAGISAGADMINDIWALQYELLNEKNNENSDEKSSLSPMGRLIAESGVPCVLMHNRVKATYTDFLKDVENDLIRCVDAAIGAGIDRDKIILDPGIGFGKTYEQNLQLMNDLQIMNNIYAGECRSEENGPSEGFPWLLGTSRKSMIGLALDLPADERLEGTLVTTVLGVMAGCSIIRVHDVKENLRAVRMTQAILGSGNK